MVVYALDDTGRRRVQGEINHPEGRAEDVGKTSGTASVQRIALPDNIGVGIDGGQIVSRGDMLLQAGLGHIVIHQGALQRHARRSSTGDVVVQALLRDGVLGVDTARLEGGDLGKGTSRA